ncbi:MAG TPA: SLBB domain-containing protein [Granulicella sp.]|nr:SLBB domain-containing protein [Granulicella sp.]
MAGCWSYVAEAVLLVGLVLHCGMRASAQVPLTAPSTSDVRPDATADRSGGPEGGLSQETGMTPSAQDAETQAGSTAAEGSKAQGTSIALPASEIINLLEQRPEVVVELKSLLADVLQRQGSEIQADDISDEMLYEQVATNADLRAHITTFLRARGYLRGSLSEDTGQLMGAGVGGVDAADSLAQSSRSLPESAAGARIAPGAGGGLFPLDLGSTGSLGGTGAAAFPPMGGRTTTAGRGATLEKKGRDEAVNASTDEPEVLHRPAPYNLQSMRDLYTQIPEQSVRLKRFGSEVFVNRDSFALARGGVARDTPLDVPLGPDYVLGPGDTLTIAIWGGVTQSFTRMIDRDGRILLPEAGSVELAGMSLGSAQRVMEVALKQQYRNAQIAVTVSQLRSVRVYVVGDVQRPGGFDISSLATPLSALYAAGGPTAVGSLRTLRHYRGNTLVEEVDLYDFLLHGVRNGSARFEGGDTLLVPPAGPQVAVSGAVKRPAIYELKNVASTGLNSGGGESTLAAVVEDAGGFTVAASLEHITIERIDANRQRETVTLDMGRKMSPERAREAIRRFPVQDGDRVRIDPIRPYSERAIYLDGHVVRPGRQAYRDGMRVSDVLHSYADMLPEPAARGEIVRLVAPDLHAETIEFEVSEALIGNENIELQPFDTIRVFGRYQVDAPKVTVHGEVLRPGTFPLSRGMTAAQLVRMAGGFKRDALLNDADLASYSVADGMKVVGSLRSVRIGAAVAEGDRNADVLLKPGDVLTIRQITGWNEIGESVTVEGQVAFPGSYGFTEGERLSSVLRRAGGFRETAYPGGAVLVREQVRELEQKSRAQLIRQIETSSAAARLSPNLGPSDAGATLRLIQAQQDQVLAQLKSEPPSGRLVVHITEDIDSWANTPADIELRRGDVLTIPKRPGFVLVTGQVYNATALTYNPGKTAGWYLQHAGGASTTANRKEIFVIRANGAVIGRHSGGWFAPDVLSTRLNPGDVVVVPQKVTGASLLWRNLLIAAQLASSIAITTAVATL